MKRDIDSIRIDRLSDPNFKFGYSIKADGKISMKEPKVCVVDSLRAAIDYARYELGEQPCCVKCKRALHEENIVGDTKNRYSCPYCSTVFNW